MKIMIFDKIIYKFPRPAVSTSKQMSQTLTGFWRLNLRMEISFSEHRLHRTRPQWRLKQNDEMNQ